MDELVHHCLRELAFDGDLGKFRLRDVSLVLREGGGSNLAWGALSSKNWASSLD
jgi:hypothetical protein